MVEILAYEHQQWHLEERQTELLEADVLLDVKLILDQEHIELQPEVELELEEMDEILQVAVLEVIDELEYVDMDDDDEVDDIKLDEQLVIEEEDDEDMVLALDTKIEIIIEDEVDELGIEPIELIKLELADVNELYLYVIQKMEATVSREQLEEMNVTNVIDIVYTNLHLIENLCQHNGNFLQQNSKNI